MRSTVERAATLHRQAVATADAAARALESFAPGVAPPTFGTRQRLLAATLADIAARVAPGWLSVPLDDSVARPPTGTVSDSTVAVRIGTAAPLPDVRFPVLTPLLGVGHLVIGTGEPKRGTAVESRNDEAAGDSQRPHAKRRKQATEPAYHHDPCSDGLIRSVILRLLAATTPGSLRVRAVDPASRVLAPFHALFDGRLMPTPVTDATGLRTVLSEAEQWVRIPAPPGRHLLIVIAGFPVRAEAELARIEALAAAGPGTRLHFLIVTGPDTQMCPMANSTHVTFRGASMVVGDPPGGSFGTEGVLNSPVHPDADPPFDLIDDICRRVAGQAEAAAALRLADLLPDETWQDVSSQTLATTIGLTGNAPLSLRLNDLTPHWLIGGRSGAGKTAILTNLLYGLCSRYPPSELVLYLLDFTTGASFREFVPTDRDPSWIPHVRAAGIGQDRDYALAILHEINDELARRTSQYESAGVTRFADLRQVELTHEADRPDRGRRASTEPLPRIVCVIDEFLTLLAGDDHDARQAAVLLEAIARRGRSYGIHLILISQTSRGGEPPYGKRDSIFSQFPVRIALPGGGDVLDSRNSSAAALRLGTAVVNTAGGFGGPTGASRAHERVVDFPDPYAEPQTLGTLRRRLWLARPAGTPPPHVFDDHAAMALPSRIPANRRPKVYLGRSIDVPLTPVTFPMDTSPGRHVAIIGSTGAPLLETAARSLATQHRPGTVRFVIVSGVGPTGETGGELARALTGAKHRCDIVGPPGLRALAADTTLRDTYIIGFDMDGVGVDGGGPKDDSSDGGGSDGGGPDGDSPDLRRLLRDGPSDGVHLIGWWRELRRCVEDTGADVAAIVLLDVPPADATLLLDATDPDWTPRPNRALLYDRPAARTEIIVPFTGSAAP